MLWYVYPFPSNSTQAWLSGLSVALAPCIRGGLVLVPAAQQDDGGHYLLLHGLHLLLFQTADLPQALTEKQLPLLLPFAELPS